MSTSWHPTDEDLILHFYGEAAAADARRIDEHVDRCVQCRAAWLELGETLKLVDQAAMPEPGPEFERVMWARVQRDLPAPRPSVWSIRIWLPAAATIALVAVAAGYSWRAWHPTTPVAGKNGAPESPKTASATKPNSTLAERVLLGALDD